MTEPKAPAEPKWWDFIAYRRRYVSDRTWFGAAFLAAGLGSLGEIPGWWKLPDILVVVVGVALTWSGVRRAVRRGRPGAPW